jgi:hypothetical protein
MHACVQTTLAAVAILAVQSFVAANEPTNAAGEMRRMIQSTYHYDAPVKRPPAAPAINPEIVKLGQVTVTQKEQWEELQLRLKSSDALSAEENSLLRSGFHIKVGPAEIGMFKHVDLVPSTSQDSIALIPRVDFIKF